MFPFCPAGAVSGRPQSPQQSPFHHVSLNCSATWEIWTTFFQQPGSMFVIDGTARPTTSSQLADHACTRTMYSSGLKVVYEVKTVEK